MMMHSRCNGPILLGTIAICVALAVMEPDIILKKHFGPKMCEHLCNGDVGCSSYICRTSNMSCTCYLTLVTLPKQNPEKRICRINATKDKERVHAEKDLKCSQGEKIRTRRYTIQCTLTVSNHPILPGKDFVTRDRMRRILILIPYQPARQLYLDNNSVVTYPFIQTRKVLAAAYIPSHRKLVVSTRSPKLLFFSSIDIETKTIIKTKFEAQALAIDDNKQLVFMTTQLPKPCLCVMSTLGKKITVLFCSKVLSVYKYGFDWLAADPKRSLVYFLCRYKQILQFTYQGVPKGNVVEINFLGGCSLHIQGNDLYYQTYVTSRNYVLHKLSLSDHSVKQFTTLHTPLIQTMATVDKILYMIPHLFKGDLLVVNMSGMGSVTKVNILRTSHIYGVRLCLIP